MHHCQNPSGSSWIWHVTQDPGAMLHQHGSPANRTSPKWFDATLLHWIETMVRLDTRICLVDEGLTLDELRPDLIANTEGDCMELSPITRLGDGTASDLAFLGRPSTFCLATSARRSSLSTWSALLGHKPSILPTLLQNLQKL